MSRPHRSRRGIALAAVLAVALVAPLTSPASARQEHDHESTGTTEVTDPFAITPAEGETGTAIEVSGEGCLVGRGRGPGEGVVVRLTSQGHVSAFVTLPVAQDGTWAGTLEVPAGVPARPHRVEARCTYPNSEDLVVYQAQTFTVTGEGAGAEANPVPPNFNGGIEDFAPYDGQSTCSPSTKPGMAAFMRLVQRHYGGGSLGVGRACGAGGTSEHKEGRAWDWAMNAGSAGDRSRVNALMNWLFATDVRCNTYANARRLGVMYIIWNRRMFRMYDVDRGWAAYSGSSPHTDHVHFSLSRDGGAGRVSYWNPRYPAPAGWHPSQRQVDDVNVSPTWDEVQPQTGDFDGDGLDDVLWYDPVSGTGRVWYSQGGDGDFVARNANAGPGYTPIVGDFNGDCRADIFWYAPGPAADKQWQGRADRRFRGVTARMAGTYAHQVVGDYNGDRVKDILWYNPGAGEDVLWKGTVYGFVRQDINIGGNYQPFSGDFDGDRKDDIFWYRPGPAGDRLWFGKRNGFAAKALDSALNAIPIPGDYNGDDRTDVFWYGEGDAPDRVWTGRSSRQFRGQTLEASRPYTMAAAGDFDADLEDDIFWHASPFHSDRIWEY